MNVCAVICEYNPFHNGHAYMISELKNRYEMDHIVCFMSGNYVQRGEPAVMDKYRRAEQALLSGADLVLEIPAEFSSSSAGDFAACGVSMAIHTGICTHISFGLEKGTGLQKLNQFRTHKADDVLVRKRLASGCTYPEALYGKDSMLGPNAILGCEYLNALDHFDSEHRISIIPIERSGDDYLSENASGTGFASAAALRRFLQEDKNREINQYIPYQIDKEIFCFPDMLSDLLNDRILRESDFETYLDVSREISDRIKKQKYRPCSFSERVDQIKTRQYTRSRISRALLHIILGIRKEHVSNLRSNGYCPYFRVLGYRQESSLLKDLSKNESIPVFTKNSKFYEAFPDALYYDQIWHNTTGTGTELTRSPIIL